jgi:hypothetical protein
LYMLLRMQKCVASYCGPRFGEQQKLLRFTLTSYFKPERWADIIYMTQEQTLFHTTTNSCLLPHTSRIHHHSYIQNRVPIGSTAINDSHSVHYDPHHSLNCWNKQYAFNTIVRQLFKNVEDACRLRNDALLTAIELWTFRRRLLSPCSGNKQCK